MSGAHRSAPGPLCRPAPGLLIHDWGESAAVVYVPARASTHLIDGGLAAALLDWIGSPSPAADADAQGAAFEALQPHLEALLMAGIVEATGAPPSLSTVTAEPSPPQTAAQSGA